VNGKTKQSFASATARRPLLAAPCASIGALAPLMRER